MASDREPQRPRVCVVGAGPCGLTALKNLKTEGISDVVCYDEGQAIGGSWVFDDRPERHSVYDVTHLISSKRMSDFEDFPLPDDFPDFPSHRQMRCFFEDYASHFGVKQFIRLQTRVVRAELLSDHRWRVSAIGADGSQQEEIFDYLIVCSGHHREPVRPEYPGRFSGEMLHSSGYKRADPFRDKRVLVVGGGNSACDISVDVARVAQKTCISMRRGYHIVPKLIFGRPSDLLYARLRRNAPMPRSVLQRFLEVLLHLNIGPIERYGLQRPDAKLLEMHPTLNSDILNALRDGRVLPRVGIKSFEAGTVYFDDGSSEEFDVVIWGTGYRIRFPFLDKSVVPWDDAGPVPLYLKMMHKHIPSVFFIGLFQPIGCIWRLADHQARIAALQIKGALSRPGDVAARIDREISSPHWRFDKAPRHAVEVDYHDFRNELLKEIAGTS
jgi:cation diffusion facilitator CzcD-associated flavoprotein CzcO